MAEMLRDTCIYCKGEIEYSGREPYVKCGRCGKTFAVARFQSEQVKLNRALEEGEAAKAALREAEAEKQQAQQRLNAAVTALTDIDASQKNVEAQLEALFSRIGADQATREAIAGLLRGLKSGQEQGQDTLAKLMQALADSRSEAGDKLELLQTMAGKLLDTQSDVLARLHAQTEIVTLLQNMKLEADERQQMMSDFIVWSQCLREEDVRRLQEIQGGASALLSGQREISEKVDGLRAIAEQTEKSIRDFREEYQADKRKALENLYRRAESFQRDRQFVEAAQTYRDLQLKGGDDTEIRWRLVLCHYCVEYQQDDEGNWLPTILNPDLTDPEELSVRRDLKQSIGDGQDFYLEELRRIDGILDRYRELQYQVRYDVFISVKQNVDGRQTPDSDKASDLYDHLMSLGLKVFNSRRTPIPTGQQYEPYIISALMSAKVLIVVGTKAEYMNAQWVRNEWMRFQWLQRQDIKRTGKTERLLFCYLAGGMRPQQIPKALNPNRQAIVESATSTEKMDASLAFLLRREYRSEVPLERILQQMTVWLYMGRFDLVQKKYNELVDQGRHLGEPMLYLKALCAEKRVAEVDQLAGLNEDLAKLPLFILAQRMCRTDEERQLLKRLREQNEENRRSSGPEAESSVDVLMQMKHALVQRKYNVALQIYRKYADRVPYRNNVRLHLFALCAQRGVSDIDLLPGGMARLADEPFFAAARENCTNSADIQLLTKLQCANEDYIAAHQPRKQDAGARVERSREPADLEEAVFEQRLNRVDEALRDGDYQLATELYEALKRQMQEALTLEQYDRVNWIYRRCARRESFKNSVWLYLYGLCAERRVPSPDVLVRTASLRQEPMFQAALSACSGSDEREKLEELLRENEKYFAQTTRRENDEIVTRLADERERRRRERESNGDAEQQKQELPGTRQEAGRKGADQRDSVEQGDAGAQYELGMRYYLGRDGLPRDWNAAAKWFRKAAEQGHKAAQSSLGECYHYGRGVKQDYSLAAKWYYQAAGQGDTSAQNNLGVLYEYGNGVTQNKAEAVKWYRLAAEQGHPKAQNNLATMYHDGDGIDRDYAEAMKWYRKAAAQGNLYAQLNIGKLYQFGMGVSADPATAARWYLQAAEAENAEAQYRLGWLYERGQGVRQNDQVAANWYRKAAKAGVASAQNNLGLMYDQGRGVGMDKAEAVKWYRLAAAQGDAMAQNNLGSMYYGAEGVQRDYGEAMKLFRQAAAQGNAVAQMNIGKMYERGHGVTQDLAEAAKWYATAAGSGNADAQCNLGWLYENGRGVKQNYMVALKWYKKAAEQDHTRAQNNLGAMYYNGSGVAKNYSEAMKWFYKAANKGFAMAQLNIGKLYFYGYGVAKNQTEAAKWYRKAAEQGSDDAQLYLGDMYDHGWGVYRDKGEAAKWYRKSAEQGNAKAIRACKQRSIAFTPRS